MPDKSTPEKKLDDIQENRFERRRWLTERLSTLRRRTRSLEMELTEYTSKHFRVCIFGSARIQEDDEIYKMTHRVAYLLGERGIDVLTGGGPGLMQAANKGVKAGRESSGSKSWSFGISIELGKREPANEHLDVKHHHHRFSSRLDDFMRLSNAVIVTPGGIGTLLELYFSWQLIQVGHMSERPIVLLKSDFYEGLIDWMRETQVKQNLVSPGDMDCIHLVDTPEEACEIIGRDHDEFLKAPRKRPPLEKS